MVAFAILGVIALYLGLCFFVVRALPGVLARWVAVLVALYLPFWDVPFGYGEFQGMCTADAGLQSYERIRPQDSVFLHPSALVTPGDLLRRGLKVVEWKSKEGVLERQSLGGRESGVGAIASRYGLRHDYNKKLPWNVLRHDKYLYRIADGQIAAQYTTLSWRSWLQVEAAPLLGTGLQCPDPPNPSRIEDLLRLGT